MRERMSAAQPSNCNGSSVLELMPYGAMYVEGAVTRENGSIGMVNFDLRQNIAVQFQFPFHLPRRVKSGGSDIYFGNTT